MVVEDLSAEKEGAKALWMEESDDAGLMVDTMLLEVEKVQLNVGVEDVGDESNDYSLDEIYITKPVYSPVL